MRNWNVLRIDVISSSQNINVSLVKNDIPCMRAHLVAQLCLSLLDPMDCRPPASSVHGDSPGKNTGVGFHSLLQGIFLTHRSNLGLWHCRQIIYHLSHQGKWLYFNTLILHEEIEARKCNLPSHSHTKMIYPVPGLPF